MDPTFCLAGAGPTAAARVVAGRDPASARPAADGREAVVLQRVDQHAVLGDVAVDVVLRPARERRDLDLAACFSSQPTTARDAGCASRRGAGRWPRRRSSRGLRSSGRTLRSAQHRSGSRRQRSGPYCSSCWPDGDLRRERDDVDGHGRGDRVSGADRLDEVVAGVEEDDVDARARRARRGGRDGVAHRRRDAEPAAERLDGPLDDRLGRRELELGSGDRARSRGARRCRRRSSGSSRGRRARLVGRGWRRRRLREQVDGHASGAARGEQADELHRERPQALAALPGAVRVAVREQVLARAVRAVQRD